jgi:mono/diheme cytochrome c family protein
VAFAAALLLPAGAVSAQVQAVATNDGAAPTWAEDVLPIFQESCQTCHRPNSIAPESFMTYQDVQRYARMISYRVENRIMPPWHLNPDVGIQDYENYAGLSAEQRETIVAWAAAGAPQGDMSKAPAPLTFDDALVWRLADQFGEPDLVLNSGEYDLGAVTEDKWWHPVTETGLTEERWAKAIEIRPANPQSRTVVHHVLASLIQNEADADVVGQASTDIDGVRTTGGLFMEWAVGKAGQIFRPDAGKLMLPGSQIRWELHLHASGTEVPNTEVQMAIWFHDSPPKYRTVLTMYDASNGSNLDIPPNTVAVTQNSYVLRGPARIENFQPHMHMRGKAMSMQAIYPDGHKETLAFVDNFQWNWQNNYVFAADAAPLLPKGTTIVVTAWHDNTEDNPSNPDPRQFVGWGDRTVDEMAHDWSDVTYLDQEYFDQLVAERAQRERPTVSDQP